jgi:hypothetical protein
MAAAPDSLLGLSLEWTGHHHSATGDFADLATHTVTYETEAAFYVTAGGALVGEGTYSYLKLDDQIGVCIYRPEEYRGQPDVVLNAIFDFGTMKDRAVITAGGEPLAVADGDMREVETPPRPSRT